LNPFLPARDEQVLLTTNRIAHLSEPAGRNHCRVWLAPSSYGARGDSAEHVGAFNPGPGCPEPAPPSKRSTGRPYATLRKRFSESTEAADSARLYLPDDWEDPAGRGAGNAGLRGRRARQHGRRAPIPRPEISVKRAEYRGGKLANTRNPAGGSRRVLVWQ
jgi:hypothetical protein